ncbi:hypothetical protein [Paenarthrobacter ilicis]|uniref:Uncharacterized protein n=1 Tax=Paenarthrobacter ilicis TaxID=43665 RepID=A0ABX0THB5_9MICC|nr:hypothetical protein [Paenarthrobacter ilicis]MBM7793304.1 hypothetical protein [Paenarthrobacter ilicis]NIJ01920.1 hypothetical protein [Paenarthrobacter ilicis]
MPWWFWVLLWIALIALALLLHVTLGYRLFRKFMTTVRELGEAGQRFSTLPPAPDAAAVAEADDRPVPGSAVFASPDEIRHDYVTAKAMRQDVRRQRRIQRKADRGQPQSLRDIEFS